MTIEDAFWTVARSLDTTDTDAHEALSFIKNSLLRILQAAQANPEPIHHAVRSAIEEVRSNL